VIHTLNVLSSKNARHSSGHNSTSDVALFPGITGTHLESLFRRLDAQSVIKSILFHKFTRTSITGVGLEPLQNSIVLESVLTFDSQTLSSLGRRDLTMNSFLISSVP
jgi:hypothetical protein